jgi:hypothetical protein
MCKSKAPDTTQMNQAALMSAETGRAALTWFTNEYDKTVPDRKRAADEAIAVSQAQRGLMDTQTRIANDYDQYNRTTYRPLEQDIVRRASEYDTPARRTEEVRRATADVEMQAGRQRYARMSELASFGIAPDSGKAQSINASDSINTARMAAGASSAARRQVEATGTAMRADAANMGRNLPSAQAAAVQTANNAGNSAVGNSNAALSAQMSGTPLMQTGFNTALQGNQIAGNLYGQQAQIQASGGNDFAALMGGMGGLMEGFGAMRASSSKTFKTDERDIDENEALAAVNETPVEAWKYKRGMVDMGGAAAGKTHVGPYAEDVQAAQGDETAPDGKMVDGLRIAENNAKAIKALSAAVDTLLNRIAAQPPRRRTEHRLAA